MIFQKKHIRLFIAIVVYVFAGLIGMAGYITKASPIELDIKETEEEKNRTYPVSYTDANGETEYLDGHWKGTCMYYGTTGRGILAVQAQLKELGYYNGIVDGRYEDNTKNAVWKFQHDNGIKEAGIGTYTLEALHIPADFLRIPVLYQDAYVCNPSGVNASSLERTIHYGNNGRIAIDRLGISVAVYDVTGYSFLWKQDVIDKVDTAIAIHIQNHFLIADHSGQEFENLPMIQTGDILKWYDDENTVTTYRCVRCEHGTNTDDIRNESGEIWSSWPEELTLYTCEDEGGVNVFCAIFERSRDIENYRS